MCLNLAAYSLTSHPLPPLPLSSCGSFIPYFILLHTLGACLTPSPSPYTSPHPSPHPTSFPTSLSVHSLASLPSHPLPSFIIISLPHLILNPSASSLISPLFVSLCILHPLLYPPPHPRCLPYTLSITVTFLTPTHSFLTSVHSLTLHPPTSYPTSYVYSLTS